MTDQSNGHYRELLDGPGMMVIAALLFGYFGYAAGLGSTTAWGQYVLFFALLIWTLKVAAVAFGASAIACFVNRPIGNVLHAITSLATAAAFAIVAVMDVLDTANACAAPWFLLGILAALCARSGVGTVRSLMATRDSAQRDAA